MPRHFLGKPIPDISKKRVTATIKQPWFGVAVGVAAPLLLALSILFLLFVDFAETPRPDVEPVSMRSIGTTVRTLGSQQLADTKTGTSGSTTNNSTTNGTTGNTTKAADTKATEQQAVKETTCGIDLVNKKPNAAIIFPIVPNELRYKEAGLDGSGLCPPSAWNLNVFRFFAYKALTLLNWLAGATIVIMTVLAGLYYISGFANEANVKKAKKMLIIGYTGLAIVVLARVIVYGSIDLFSAGEYNPNIPPKNSTEFIK